MVIQDGISHVNIAYQHIKDRRARRNVPIPPGGTLADYVPFYFAPRSPMLYTINQGNVDCEARQCTIVHLVSSVEQVEATGCTFCFTDGHADMAISKYYRNPEHLSLLDWPLMKSRYWNDTIEDNDRKRRRQAEFLVHSFFPLALVQEIGVFDNDYRNLVTKILDRMGHNIPIKVWNGWYF